MSSLGNQRTQRTVTGNRLTAVTREKPAHDRCQITRLLFRDTNIIGAAMMIDIRGANQGQVARLAPRNQEYGSTLLVKIRNRFRAFLDLRKYQMRAPHQTQRRAIRPGSG